jgi:hypothetical protein
LEAKRQPGGGRPLEKSVRRGHRAGLRT